MSTCIGVSLLHRNGILECVPKLGLYFLPLIMELTSDDLVLWISYRCSARTVVLLEYLGMDASFDLSCSSSMKLIQAGIVLCSNVHFADNFSHFLMPARKC